MNEPELSPTQPEHPPVEAGQAEQPVKRSKLPDFQPLGAIRDYFTEQMKQDSIR